jgi:hypothetical protein
MVPDGSEPTWQRLFVSATQPHPRLGARITRNVARAAIITLMPPILPCSSGTTDRLMRTRAHAAPWRRMVRGSQRLNPMPKTERIWTDEKRAA